MKDHHMEAPPYRTAAPGDTLGLRHLVEALADLPFPAGARDIRAWAGNWRIPITGGHYHRLHEFLEGVDEDERFERPEDLARAVGRAHPELRE